MHLLLGNGFSRACRNDLFSYDALFLKAEKSLSAQARKAFKTLKTSDFEVVMRALGRAADLVQVYARSNKKLYDAMTTDRDNLREALAVTIAGTHPERPNDITEDEYRACRRFMAKFESYYTLNYDLLLYWASRQNDVDELKIDFNDGFHQPDEGKQDYVVWDIGDVGRQNAFYLHGGLHIFDAGAEVQKYTWINTGEPLIDQIREALSSNKFPIYVAEGSSESKRERVHHSAFLSRGYRSLATIGGNLFIFGVSFAPNDEHILRLIEENKVTNVFVSVFHNPKSAENQTLIARALHLADGRTHTNRRETLSIHFFDAESAEVWG